MQTLTLKDLSRTEELDRQAMAAVRGGHGRHHHGMPPGLAMQGYVEEPVAPVINFTQVIQQGIGNVNGSPDATVNPTVTLSGSSSLSFGDATNNAGYPYYS